MPTYSFVCGSVDHIEQAHGAKRFEQVIQHGAKKRIDQTRCGCGGVAKRDFVGDAETIFVTGLTPIRPMDAKHAIGRELEYGFGRFKRNPDGSLDKNHSPFRDTGELGKFMAGGNDLGAPKVDDNGNPVRRRDGSIVRDGAKLFKYGPNATPSKDGVRKGRFVAPRSIVASSGWGSEASVDRQSSGAASYQGLQAQRHKNPERRSG